MPRPGKFRLPLFLLLFSLAPVLAGTSDTSKAEPAPGRPKIREQAIPYPNGGLYLDHGIHGTFAGGGYRNYGAGGWIYQWQGELGYFYTSWFSGGFGYKIRAGEQTRATPGDTVDRSRLEATVKNRFFLMGRAHQNWKTLAGYLGLQLGVDDLSVSLRPLADSGNFQEPLRETNAGLDLEFGLGWKATRHFGLTFGNRLELSLVGEGTGNPDNAVNFRALPGMAFDLAPLFPSLAEAVHAFHVVLEMQFGRLVRERITSRQDIAWITGVSLAF